MTALSPFARLSSLLLCPSSSPELCGSVSWLVQFSQDMGDLYLGSAWGNLDLNLLPPEFAPYPRDYQLFCEQGDLSPFFEWESLSLTFQSCSGDTHLGGETTSARACPSQHLKPSMEVFPGRQQQTPGFLLSVVLWEQAHRTINLIHLIIPYKLEQLQQDGLEKDHAQQDPFRTVLISLGCRGSAPS